MKDVDLHECPAGWLMALKDIEDSAWGGVEDFIADVSSLRGDPIHVESDVWGKMFRSGLKPQPGDGIGFYHSKRARFPKPDPHRGRPRISLFGILDEVYCEGQDVHFIAFRVIRDHLERALSNPVIRTASTEGIFEECGMSTGRVGTFWPVPRHAWLQLLAEAHIISDNPASAHGAGIGGSEDQRAAERAAVQYVGQHYAQAGWRVESVERDRTGYDLVARKGTKVLHLEVKGVTGSRLEFIMTAAEHAASGGDPAFRLCLVTNALVRPTLDEWSGSELAGDFRFKPLQYRVTLKQARQPRLARNAEGASPSNGGTADNLP